MRLVTTPIFYVNAAPHIGHLYSMVLADVAHRFQRLAGNPSRLSTGTDEHGTKVARAAAAAGTPPKPFVDRLSNQFRELANAGNIDYARFVRTTDADHVAEASHVWDTLRAKGWIYRAKHAGWYCVSDETFYPETELVEVDGNLKSRESGSAVEWYEEENWFFKLSELRPKLVELLEQRPDFVLPTSRHRALLAELRAEPLADLSISRPRARCAWGIPVPGDENQTMYVWFEALINYLTVARSQSPHQSLADWWPATHIVGKDIVRFHAVYWPAFLLAAELPVPEQVVVHSHWTLEGVKMSKSKKNVVDPFEMIKTYGLDSVRYVLAHDGALAHDSPFSPARLTERHNVNLVNKWANLVSRVSAPKFSIGESLRVWGERGLPGADGDHLAERCAAYAASFEFGRYAQIVNDAGMAANLAFQAAEPWTNPEHPDSRVAVALAADTCRVMAILLQPICPTYAKTVLDKLDVAHDKRSLEHAALGADLSYGKNVTKGHILKRI